MRDQANQDLDANINDIFAQHERRYGAPRITKELIAEGMNVGENRVARRMKALGLRAKQAKKFKATTDSNHQYPVAENLLQQDFSASKPNEKWLSDITYLWTGSGWLYLAVVLDVYSRKIIGWSMSKRINQELVCNALLMALWRRGFPKGVIVHSDRGSQYCSNRYQKLLKDHKLICSMSGKGNCYDNAAMETFFHSMKVECIHGEYFKTREEMRKTVFEYIELYYNRVRRHSTIGYLAPSVYEERYLQAS